VAFVLFQVEAGQNVKCISCERNFTPVEAQARKDFQIPIHVAEPKHGSPTFYKLLEEMSETHSKKSHDYASNDNPFGNYTFAGKIACMFAHSELDAGFVGRFAEKLFRLANLESSKKTPSNESIEDTERDMCVIIALWMAARRDNRKQSVPNF
jgi:hypothetical protein